VDYDKALFKVVQRFLPPCYRENLTNIVEIKDIKFEVFEKLLKYIYSGRVDNLNKHTADLFRAAEKVKFLLRIANFNPTTLFQISVQRGYAKKSCNLFIQASTLTPELY
jgi:hypothetical protein